MALQLIASPFLGSHLVVSPGRRNGVKIPQSRYAELRSAPADALVPGWLAEAADKAWGMSIGGLPLGSCAVVRAPSVLGYGRASYEVNMGCNYACKHCYLGLLPLELNVVVTTDNAHEVEAMHAIGESLGIGHRDYRNMSPTIHGGAEPLAAQSLPHLTMPKPFTGCDAGHTSFHVDPHGSASICKIGREPSIPLAQEGAEGLFRLGGIADGLLHRQGGCAGCGLSASCGTCMPLAARYRQAHAPLERYCQHGRKKEVTA
jgi:hypothetical protein